MKVKSKPITTQEQFQQVATRIEQLKDATPNSGQAFELKLLTNLLIDYLKRSKTELAFLNQNSSQWIRRLYLHYV
jgi:hypothetical protein